jgi:acyl-CoA dehydrogenase
MIRPGDARDRLTAGIYITNDPQDITGCLEDALAKVIKAEPIERRLRREQLDQQELEDHAQWLARLLEAKQITTAEAELLRQAREATQRVVAVDDFTPEQLLGRVENAPEAGASGKRVNQATKKKVVKKVVKKKKAASNNANKPDLAVK